MQQRLRRNAPAVKAYAAGIHLRIDQRNLEAKIGGEECGGVTAGSAADHGDAELLGVFGRSGQRWGERFVHEVTFFNSSIGFADQIR
jgi:hypothetical protein